MNNEEAGRLNSLVTSEFVSIAYLKDFYGLTWPFTGELSEDFLFWTARHRRPKQSPEGMVSRFDIESFMQAKKVVSIKWMAARFGMTTDSFDAVGKKLFELGLRLSRYLLYDQMVAPSLSEDIIPNLPGLRFRTFGDHNSFCLRLHAELKEALDVTIRPLFCSTSDSIQEYPRQFANAFDCLTLQPLSTKHAVWLDFRKPLSLEPDRCSKLFYAQNRETLRPYCAGTSEPADLYTYLNLVAERGDAGE